MKKTLLTLLLLASISNFAIADPRALIGHGTASCGKFNALQSDPGSLYKDSFVIWVLGYLSGLNSDSKIDFLADTDSDAIKGALIVYCQNNPLDKVIDAANSIHLQLLKRAR
jgi:hypothetical protein